MTNCIICNIQTHEKNDSNQTIHNSCMNDYNNYSQKLMKVKGCCMCGNTKRKLIENTCNKCINSIY